MGKGSHYWEVPENPTVARFNQTPTDRQSRSRSKLQDADAQEVQRQTSNKHLQGVYRDSYTQNTVCLPIHLGSSRFLEM